MKRTKEQIEKKKQQDKQNRQNFRKFRTLKKKQVEKMEISQIDNLKIQDFIDDQKEQQLILILKELSLQKFIEVVFGQNMMGTIVFIRSLKAQMINFVKYTNQVLTKHINEVQHYFNDKQNQAKHILISLLKIFVQLIDSSKFYYLQNLKKEVSKQKSFFSYLFSFLNFQQTKRLFLQTQHVKLLIELILSIFESHEITTNISQFVQYLKECKYNDAWQKDSFDLTQNLCIYTLKQLQYNTLHHYANTKQQTKFIESFLKSDYQMINQFNNCGDTCIDIALRNFSKQSLNTIFQILVTKQEAKVSISCLNNLLQNKLLFSSIQLQNLIKILLQLSSNGFISRIHLQSGQHDVAEFFDKNMLLMRIDKQSYPLLNYIKIHTQHSQSIIELLITKKLVEYSSIYIRLIQQNSFMQKMRFILKQNHNSKKMKKAKLELLIDNKTIYNFQIYIKSLIETSVKYLSTQLVIKIIQTFGIFNIFTNTIGKGADFNSHILFTIVNYPQKKQLVQYFIQQIFKQASMKNQTTIINPLKKQLMQQLFKTQQQKNQFEQLQKIKMNLINEIFISVVDHFPQNIHSNLLKAKFRQYYLSSSNQRLSFIMRNNQYKYIFIRLSYCLSQEQIINIISSTNNISISKYLLYQCNQNKYTLDFLNQQKTKYFMSLFIIQLMYPTKILINKKYLRTKKKITFYQTNYHEVQKQKIIKDDLITNLFMMSFQCNESRKQYQKLLLQYHIDLTIKRIIPQLFQNKNTELLEYWLSSNFQFQIIKQANLRMSNFDNTFQKQILENWFNKKQLLSKQKLFISIPLLKLPFSQNVLKKIQEFALQGINTSIDYFDKKLFKEFIKTKECQEQINQGFKIMGRFNSSYFESLLYSDDNLEIIKKNIKSNFSSFVFFRLISNKQLSYFKAAISFGKCNYQLLVWIQQQFKKRMPIHYQKIPIQQRMISLCDVLKVINLYCSSENKDFIFQKIYKVIHCKIVELQFEYTIKNQVALLFSQLSSKISIKMIEKQDFLILSLQKRIRLMLTFTNILTPQDILDTLQKFIDERIHHNFQQSLKQCSIDSEEQLKKIFELEIIFLKYFIKKQINGNQYSSFLNHFKKFLSVSDFNQMKKQGLKYLCIYRPQLSTQNLLRCLTLFDRDELNQLLNIVRFKGELNITLTLLFCVNPKKYSFILFNQSKQQKQYYSSKSICLSLQLSIFKRYIQCGINIVNENQKYINMFIQITSILSKAKKYAHLKILLQIIEKTKFVVICIRKIFSLIVFRQSSEQYFVLMNLAYNILKFNYLNNQKGEQMLNSQKLSIFLHKRQVIDDFPFKHTLKIKQYVEYLKIDFNYQGLLKYQQNIQKYQMHSLDIKTIFKLVKQMLRYLCLIMQKVPLNLKLVQIIMKNIEIISNAYSQYRSQNIIQVAMKIIIEKVQSNKELLVFFQKQKFTYRKVLLSNSISNLQNYINYFDLFQNQRNRQYFIKYSNRNILKKYISYLKKEDLDNIILHSNSLELLLYFTTVFNLKDIENKIIQYFYKIVQNKKQSYAIQLIDHFDLYASIIQNQKIQLNIFEMMIFRKFNKLFIKVILWIKQNDISIFKNINNLSDLVKKQGCYFLKYVDQFVDNSNLQKFENLGKFIQNIDLEYQIKISQLIPKYHKKLQCIKQIKSFFENIQQGSMKNQVYSLYLHRQILTLVFNLKTQNDNVEYTNYNNTAKKFMKAIEFYTSNPQLLTQNQLKNYLKNNLICLLCLHLETQKQNKLAFNQMAKQYTFQTKIIKLITQNFQKKIILSNKNSLSFPSYLIEQKIVSDIKLLKFLFKFYKSQIVYDITSQTLQQYSDYIICLLPCFNQLYNSIEQITVYKKGLQRIEITNPKIYAKIMIMNWCCYPNLKGNIEDLLSKLNILHYSILYEIIHQIQKLNLQNKQTIRRSEQQTQQLLKIIFKQFYNIINLSSEVKQNILNTIMSVKNPYFLNLSILSLHFFLNTLVFDFKKELESICQKVKIQIVLDTFETQMNQNTLNIKLPISISINKILQVQCQLLGGISKLRQTIQNKYWISINRLFIQNSLANSVISINEFNQQSHQIISNVKTIVEFEDFMIIKSIFEKQKIMWMTPLQRIDGIFYLHKTFEDLRRKIITKDLYKVNEISAPHSLKNTVFPEFYELISLSENCNIVLKYVNQTQFLELQKQQDQRLILDMKQYNILLQNTINQKYQEYSFSSVIFYHFLNDKPLIYLNYFSASNIIQLHYIFNKFKLASEPNKNLNIRLEQTNLIYLINRIKLSNQKIVEILLKITQNPNLIDFTRFIGNSILKITPNINSTIQGLRVNFKLTNEQDGGILIFEHPNLKLHRCSFEINEPIMDIYIFISITDTNTRQWLVTPTNPQITSLFKQEQFINCLFQSTSRFVDHYFNKSIIEFQLLQLSKKLTKTFSQMINISIDYSTLYTIIDKIKRRQLSQLENILNKISDSFVENIQNKLIIWRQSNNTSRLFNSVLHLRAYQINYPQDRQTEVLKYKNKNNYFRFLMNLNSKVSKKIESTYLIQIFKSQFLNSLILHNVYLIGMKNNDIICIEIDSKQSQTFKKLQFDNISWICLVAKSLPDETIISKDKIVSVAIVDMLSNVYQIDGLKQYLFENPKSISQFVDIIPNHFNVLFSQNNHLLQKNTNTLIYLLDNKFEGKLQNIVQRSWHPSLLIRSLIQSRIFQFIEHTKQNYEIMLSFQQNIKIKNIEKIQQILQIHINMIQKSLLQLLKSQQNIIIEQIASIAFPQKDLSCYQQSRKLQILKDQIKTIHFRICSSQSQIQIKDFTLIINVCIDHNQQLKLDEKNINIFILSQIWKKFNMNNQIILEHVENNLTFVIFYELQIQSIKIVKRLFQNYSFVCHIQNQKQRIVVNEDSVKITFSKNKIYSPAQIISHILKISYNKIIPQYFDGQIKLHTKLKFISQVLIIPLCQKQCVDKISVNLQNTDEINIHIPQNSIYFIIGNQLIWNKTCCNIQQQLTCETNQTVSIYYNILTNDYNVAEIKKYSFSYYKINQPIKLVPTKLSLVTRSTLKADFLFKTSGSFSLNPPKVQFPYILHKSYKQVVEVVSKNIRQVFPEKTKFIGIIKNKSQKVTYIKTSMNKEFINNYFKQPFVKLENNKEIVKESSIVVKQYFIKQKPLIITSSQYSYLTSAGKIRTDIIELCDFQENSISTEIKDINIFFQYADNHDLKIYPKIVHQQLGLFLIWTPIVKGKYEIVINNVVLKPNHQIAVIASNNINLQNIKLQLPKTQQINFCQQQQFTVEYEDQYGNKFAQIEQIIYPEKMNIIIISENKNFNFRLKNIDKKGKQVGYFVFENQVDQFQKTETNIIFKFKQITLNQLHLVICGLPLIKRKANFENQLSKYNQLRYRTIAVKRSNFIEQLVSHVNDNLNLILTVNFVNQPGIDAGGLKRQFYDMIGSQMKNEKYNFFKPIIKTRLQYTFNPNVHKNKKNHVYIRCFAKFLANSILNGYYIGVDFLESFVKIFYQIPIIYEDLKGVLDQDVYTRYESLLNLTEQEISDMCLTFTKMNQKAQEIQIIKGGKYITVTKDNVISYLNNLARYELFTKDEQLFKVFIDGFNQVFPFDIIKKHFRPSEFFILSCGNIKISGQSIIQILVFPNQKPLAIAWFKRYIQEASNQILTNFLKFTTGSSSLPYDLSSSKITIDLKSMGNNPQQLPISHTCWKSIQIPIYKTYQIMQTKLNIAFLYASQGFGFG